MLTENNDNKQVTSNAGRVEVGHPVLGADRLRPGRRASTVVVAGRPRVNVLKIFIFVSDNDLDKLSIFPYMKHSRWSFS
jgi:hypothetical protein